MDKINSQALTLAQENGIVFIDEIDKICGRSNHSGADVSREGVQRDLLPLIEGCTVSTKYGSVQTEHILFITSGAFHTNKPADLLPELQGRLPIRVNLSNLNKEDFVKILKEPEANLVRQYKELMKTENLELEFTDDAIEEIASLAVDINCSIENIGARRLHTIMEKVLEDISFTACDKSGKHITIDATYVKDTISPFAQSSDLSKFIL